MPGFAVDDAFFITGRGLVLVGQLAGGEVQSGQQLRLPDGRCFLIKGISWIGRQTAIGLLLATTITSRAEAADAGLLGVIAEVIN